NRRFNACAHYSSSDVPLRRAPKGPQEWLRRTQFTQPLGRRHFQAAQKERQINPVVAGGLKLAARRRIPNQLEKSLAMLLVHGSAAPPSSLRHFLLLGDDPVVLLHDRAQECAILLRGQ